MLTNWKTTIPGILMLLTVAYNAWTTKTVNVDDVIAALAGLGFTQAKDWNVTGGTKQL